MKSINNNISCENCDSRLKSIFCDLRVESLEQLSNSKHTHTFKANQFLYSSGERLQGVFCIHKGKIKIERIGDNGEAQLIGFAKDGDVLGYSYLLLEKPTETSAIVLEDSIICYVRRETFFNLIQTNYNLNLKIINSLSDELTFTQTRMLGFGQKTVKERIAESLILLSKAFGFEKDSNYINIQVSRHDLSTFVGTADESLIRILSDLKKEGLISISKRKIGIENFSKLAEVAKIKEIPTNLMQLHG